MQTLYQKLTFPNGLRLLLAENHKSPTFTVLVLVEAGLKYETKAENGISHFLEHMCFHGTKKRPSALAISSELDGIGAYYNAFTGNEYTGYFIKSHRGHFNHVLDVISDIYLRSLFDPQTIEREKGVVIEESNRSDDNPSHKIADSFMRLLYGNQPAGWKILGEIHNIRKFNRNDFISYHKKHYRAKSTVVVISGDFSKKEAVHLIKEKFAEISSGKGIIKKKVVECQKKPAFSFERKKIEQARFILGFRGVDLKSPLRFPVEILVNILGGSMSSRLFEKIRNQMGATYDISTDQDNFTDHGIIATSAGIEISKLEKVLLAVLDEHKAIAQKGVNKEELVKAKEHLKGRLTLSLETSNAIAGFLGSQEILLKKILSPKDIFRKINAVSQKQIQDVARKFFVPRNLNLAVLGPYRSKKDFEALLRKF